MCMSTNLVTANPAGSNSTGVVFPNGTTIHSTHIGLLPNARLPHSVPLVHLFVGLNKVLLSLGQFCDADVNITLTKCKFLAVKCEDSQKNMLQGSLITSDGMWHMNLSKKNETSDQNLMSMNKASPRPPPHPTVSNHVFSRQKTKLS